MKKPKCEECGHELTPCWEFKDTWWCPDCQVYVVGHVEEYKIFSRSEISNALKEISGVYSKIYIELGGRS